jgi:hypothetical protein
MLLGLLWVPASASTPDGEWELVPAESADIPAAIEAAVAKMNFVKRPIARSRLKKTNPAYRKIVLSRTADHIAVKFDAGKPVQMPADGTAAKWTRDDGETFDVSGSWQDARVTQQFVAEDGKRSNVFRLSADGSKLTLDVELTSDQLAAPVRYTLAYRRVR